jgi:hypothetical protein
MKRVLLIVSALLCLAGAACLAMFFMKGAGAGKLSWEDPIVRKSLMTFAYKIYGDPGAQNGRHFLSKMVFKNEGTAPVRDFSISYQIPDYIPWTSAETRPEIQPGQTVVQLYYPQLPAKVTQLANSTTATLETRIRWSNKEGETKEELLRSNVQLRGVNELEYTDVPADDQLTWYDMFATTPFSVAMVTPNDPVVKEFISEVTKRTGGTMAGVNKDPKEVARMMKAIYDYMCESGMRYTSNSGVPAKLGDVHTMVQTVRLPRDVIISNEGLCIELAILWAAIMEHIGIQANLVFIPGHAITVVRYGPGATDMIPIETTAITPMAVGAKQPVSFEDAVKMAGQNLEKAQNHMWVDVRAYQKQGFRAPELAHIEVDKIKNILAERTKRTAAAYAQTAATSGAAPGRGQAPTTRAAPPPPPPNAQSPQARPGYYRWAGAGNMLSLEVPDTWQRMENSPVAGMIFTAQDMQTSLAVNVFHFPNISSAQQAMEAARKGVSRTGATVRVANQQQKGNGMIYTGTTSTRQGSTEWVGMFSPTPAGTIGMFIGAAQGYFQQLQPMVQDILASARFNTGENMDANANADMNGNSFGGQEEEE